MQAHEIKEHLKDVIASVKKKKEKIIKTGSTRKLFKEFKPIVDKATASPMFFSE